VQVELETARRDLRVADEEVRSWRAAVVRLLESERTRGWQRERLADVLPVPVVVTDAEGTILTANVAAASALGMRKGGLVGMALSDFLSLESGAELERRLKIAVAERSTFRQVVALSTGSGTTRSAELAANVFHDAGARVTEVTCVLLETDDGVEWAVHNPVVAGAFVELSELPLHRVGLAASVKQVAGVFERVLGTDTSVSVTVGPPLEPELVAATSKLAQLADGAQMVASDGPSLTAWEERRAMKVGDLGTDGRWRRFAALADPYGVRSVLCMPIVAQSPLGATERKPVGVLNLYSKEAHSFDGVSGVIAEQLVAAMAAVLQEIYRSATLQDTVRSLTTALESRATIEQAKGVIIAAAGVDAEEAFARLVKMSRATNVKLRVLASQIVLEASGRGAGSDGTPG